MSLIKFLKNLLGLKPAAPGKPRPATPPEDLVVTKEYAAIRHLLEAGCPLLLVSGKAGTGKSTLIRYLRQVLPHRLAVVAPTGVAALNIQGATIHSFCHLPPKIHEDKDIKYLSDRRLYERLELLIIDEVSMVRADLLDSVDRFLRRNRRNSRPFGGVQLLLVGDLFQLPPVVPPQEWQVLQAKGYASPYFFSAFSLRELALAHVELTTVFRQQDADFVQLLNKIRQGEELEEVVPALNAACSEASGTSPGLTLTCTNSQADRINRESLLALPGPEYEFVGRIQGQFSLERDRLPAPWRLRLRAGAQVMFTRNDEQRRWVNGSLGRVRRVQKHGIWVEVLAGGRGLVYEVTPAVWETYRYAYDPREDRIIARKVGQYTQYPLILAWAVTIHKAQGQTLDQVLVDLGRGAFAPGQVYVALSRCRTLQGLRLARPLQVSEVKTDPLVKQFYRQLLDRAKDGPPH